MQKEERGHTTIAFSRSTIATIVGVVVVIGALAFWNDRGKASATTSVTHDLMVTSNAGRITEAEKGIVKNSENHVKFKDETKERFVSNEKTQIKLEKDQQAILNNQVDFKTQQQRHTDLILEQMRVIAETNAWIKTLDRVSNGKDSD